MTLKGDANFEEKLTFCLKNNMSSGKSKNMYFHGLLLPKAYM